MRNTNSTSTTHAVYCPQCGVKGKKVERITLESLLSTSAALRIGEEQYRFCNAIDCETVYFGESGNTFSKSDLTVRVGVKERTSPRHVCYCFDHTIEEIDAEVQETGQSTIIDDIKARMNTACWCESKNPQGSCCLGTVSKYINLAMAKSEQSIDANESDNKQTDCCTAGANKQSACNSEATDMNDCCSTTNTSDDTKTKGQRTGLLAVGGSMLAALAASACCWIPLTLIAFGVSAGGISAWFEQYRWLFLGLTSILLGTGFYFVYFKTPHCAQGSACATSKLKLHRFNRVMLWVATVVVITTAAFPNYVAYLIPEDEPAQITIPSTQVATASMSIEGMTCEACSLAIKNALVKVPGVLDATVSYAQSSAIISFDNTMPPSNTDLASAITAAGYKVDTSAINR